MIEVAQQLNNLKNEPPNKKGEYITIFNNNRSYQMKPVKQFLFLLALLIFFSGSKVIAQTQDFLLGAYLNSSNNLAITYYQNYWQVKQLGLNSVFQRNIVSVPSIGQESNFDSLMQFNTIIAGNDSVPVSASNENNIDWIYYFTNALYSKWEAEGSDYFNNAEPVGVKHNNIGYETIDGWSSGSNADDIGKFFILGPNYTQYMKYVYTNKYEQNNFVQYKVNFKMKLAQPQTGSFPAARVIVSVINDTTGVETILVDSVLYSDQLATVYNNFSFSYDYHSFVVQNNRSTSYTGTPPPGPAWYAPQSTASSTFFNANLKIQFKVQRLGAPEIIVDYIEVYDAGVYGIWERWFIERFPDLISNISFYNQKFASLGTKLKYFHTIDEPHSIDCFVPIKTVQNILRDTLGINRDLLTHFYPGWNNYRDSVDIIEKWINIAQPNQFMFWYFPYWANNTDEFGLSAYRSVLQQAFVKKTDFYVTTQTWGYQRANGDYYMYRTPNPAQLSAEVMLTLAHGVKGIFFEPFYSYTSWVPELGENPTVLAIVDKFQNGRYPERDIYWRIQSLANRLNGILGKTLLTLNYTGNSIYITNTNHSLNSNDFLTIQDYGYNYNWHAGFLNDKVKPDNKYFLLTNLKTTASVTANLSITNNSGYNNLRVRNIEGSSLDTTIITTSSLYQTLQAGEGNLYQVAPVVKYGGTLRVNETISGTNDLSSPMTVMVYPENWS